MDRVVRCLVHRLNRTIDVEVVRARCEVVAWNDVLNRGLQMLLRWDILFDRCIVTLSLVGDVQRILAGDCLLHGHL